MFASQMALLGFLMWFLSFSRVTPSHWARESERGELPERIGALIIFFRIEKIFVSGFEPRLLVWQGSGSSMLLCPRGLVKLGKFILLASKLQISGHDCHYKPKLVKPNSWVLHLHRLWFLTNKIFSIFKRVTNSSIWFYVKRSILKFRGFWKEKCSN